MFHQKTARNVMHERAHCRDAAASHQLPHSCGLLNHPNISTEECSSLMQNLMQIHYSTCSVILNVRATKYTCSLNGVYHPHWLVQWSCHCSCRCIPVHSPWLQGYSYVVQTVLIVLTMAGLFPDRTCIWEQEELCSCNDSVLWTPFRMPKFTWWFIIRNCF